MATTTAVTGATATDPETTVTTTTTKVHTRTGGTAEDPTIAGGNQTTTTGNVISLDLNTPTEFTPTKAGAEFQVNTYTSGYQMLPKITNLSDGGYVVTWTSQAQDDSSGSYAKGVYGQRYDASGSTVGSEFLINTTVVNQQGYPAITSFSDGGFTVIWESYGQESQSGIFGQRYDASASTVGSEFHVNTYTSSYQSVADITSLSDGSFVVTWQSYHQDGDEYGIYGQKYDSSGNVSGSEFQISTSTSGRQEQAQVTALLDGGFVVAWQDDSGLDGSDLGIFGQRYDKYGNTVASEFQINTHTSDGQEQVHVEGLKDGGFVASWGSYYQDGSQSGVYAQRYSASGETLGSEFRVNTYTNSYQLAPSISSLSDGGFIASWQSNGQDGTTASIYGQRYDPSGNAIGSEFKINTYASGAQGSPEVSVLADGSFVVVWQDETGQDGSSTGAYGQRFDAAYETPLASNASVVVNGKTLTVDLSSHHNGSVNDHLRAAATIASAINNDSDLQTAGYHATVATVDQVNAGTHAAGDVIITRAHIPDETVTTDTTSATTTAGAALSMTPTKLGEEFQVNTYTNSSQNEPVLTKLSNGGFVASWNSYGQDGSNYAVQAQMYDRWGNTVGSEFRVNSHTANDQSAPSITSLNDGGFVVIYHSNGSSADGDSYGVYGQRYDASGSTVGSEFLVNTEKSGYQLYPSVTSLSDGGFVATWHSQNQDGGGGGSYAFGVHGQRYDASGNAVGGEFQVNTYTPGDQMFSSVTALSGGGFVVAYQSLDLSRMSYGISAQRYDASGSPVGSEFFINETENGSQVDVRLAALDNGGFAAVWSDSGNDGSGYGIFGRRFDASGTAIDANDFQVNSAISGTQADAGITGLPDGGFIVTWTSASASGDTSSYGVAGQRFDASGNKIGTEFLVNTTTANQQKYPYVTALDDGDFVVAWGSDLQAGDNSELGVYAQRFASPTPSGTVTTTDHTVSTVTGSTTGEAPFGSDVSFGVGGKTLTVDLSAHHDGSNNDYYGAAEAIATAINGDSDLQALGYSAAAATLAEVNAGTYAAGDIIITRADTPTTTTNTLVGNAASFVVEGITVNTDLSAYSADLSGAAAAVASDINADAALQALDYSATADTSNPGDIIISRANTPITQAYVAAAPATTAMSLASGGSARAAMAKIDAAITTVNIQRSELGAVSNRLNHTVNNLTNISANLSAARGGIEDADFALETTQLAKLQILNQAATAMLAQANASKQNILSLLQQ